MKKNYTAFTIIELIVVSSILILVSATSVFYFGDFLDGFKLKGKLNIVSGELNSLDSEIKSKKIFDYEFNLSVGSGSYIVYKNKFDINNYTRLTMLGLTGSLNIEPITSGDYKANISNKNKTLIESFINPNSSLEYFFGDYNKYSITSYLSGSKLNDIELNYLGENPGDNLLIISNINTKEDKTGTSITNLLVKNIGGKKMIGNNLDEVYVFFEMIGQEEFIKITK